MDCASIHDQYVKYLVDPGMERAALFRLLSRGLPARTVLYPGCSIHVTPSFFFPHVEYVDVSVLARDFFAEPAEILRFVGARRNYGKQPFIRFHAADFTRALPVPECGFDLLISLYAGGISRHCFRYLRIGGHLVSNNHHDDAGEAARSGRFRLAAVVKKKSKGFVMSGDALGEYFVRRGRKSGEYRRTADYYLFKRER